MKKSHSTVPGCTRVRIISPLGDIYDEYAIFSQPYYPIHFYQYLDGTSGGEVIETYSNGTCTRARHAAQSPPTNTDHFATFSPPQPPHSLP